MRSGLLRFDPSLPSSTTVSRPPVSRRNLCLCILLGGLFAATTRGQTSSGTTEFSAQGSAIVRVELEAKLRVPLDETEQVWGWLQQRYADCSWLSRNGHSFTAALGDEHFTDVYFDTPALQLLATQSGVRHRSRTVHSGSAAAKDGRQLVQIKLNRGDASGLGRSEIKFLVGPVTSRSNSRDDSHPVIGLIVRGERDAFKQQVQQAGLDPYALRPIVTVLQTRRRVYISDQWGAFATLTLDECSTTSWGADQKWTEIELELNEIRYTEAGPEQRRSMEQFVGLIQADLQQQFPAIVQDQTPKYNKAYQFVAESTKLPLRTLIGWHLDERRFTTTVQAIALGLLGLIIAATLWFTRRHWVARPGQSSATVELPAARREPVLAGR